MSDYPKSRKETVTSTRVELSHKSSSLLIKNSGSNDVAIGDSQVTFNNAFILTAGDAISIELDTEVDTLWFVCNTGQSTTIQILDFD